MRKRLVVPVAGAVLALQVPSLVGSSAATASTGRAFHELNLAGLPNAAGFSMVGVRRGQTSYTLEVTGSSVVARPKVSDGSPLTGRDLVGVTLDLRDAAGARFTVQIADAGTTTYWAGAPESIPTYTLTYTSAAHPTATPLCTAGVNEAILYAGDRYDSERKTVTATGAATAGWFNIACAGTALAKLHLTRHTEATRQ